MLVPMTACLNLINMQKWRKNPQNQLYFCWKLQEENIKTVWNLTKIDCDMGKIEMHMSQYNIAYYNQSC